MGNVEKMIEDIKRNTEVTTEQKNAADVLKNELSEDKIVINREKTDAQTIMDQALPALDDAKARLKELTGKEFQELKAFNSPPRAIEIVAKAALVLRPVPVDVGKGDWKDCLAMFSHS